MLSKKIKKLIVKTLLVLSCFSVFVLPLKTHGEIRGKPTIMLDLAHLDRYEPSNGIIDNGASYGTLTERELVGEITLMVKDKLEKANFNIIMTRDYNTPISIGERVALANNTENIDYYISIHANATESHQGQGTEAFSNGAWSLSNRICKEIEKQLGIVNRGVFATPYYNQYIKTKSTLLELGFIDNEHDRQVLINNKEKFADIISESIIYQYKDMNNIPKEPKYIQVPETLTMLDNTKITVWKTVEVR